MLRCWNMQYDSIFYNFNCYTSIFLTEDCLRLSWWCEGLMVVALLSSVQPGVVSLA